MAHQDPLEQAEKELAALEAALNLTHWNGAADSELYAGIDLGTANVVTVLVNRDGSPMAGVLTRSGTSVRDGLVLDFVQAVQIVREHVNILRRAGLRFSKGAAAYPPGTGEKNARICAHVLEAAELNVAGIVDEPSAAALALGLTDGVVVDIGGGTTGISVLRAGRVVYTADEPTGGVHIDLVLSGRFGWSAEQAEKKKTDPACQADLFPVIQPVFQKMAHIVKQHIKGQRVSKLYLVGGTSSFPGIEKVMAQETGLEVIRPYAPMLPTPLGIAKSCVRLSALLGLSHGHTGHE